MTDKHLYASSPTETGKMLRVNYNHYASWLRQTRHAHDETTVSLVVTGSLRESVGSADVVASPFSIVVKPRGTEHSNKFGEMVRMVQIGIPAAEATQYELWDRGLGEWRWQHHGATAVRAFLGLFRTMRASSPDVRADHVEAAAIDVLAAVNASIESTPIGAPPAWLAAMREEIDDTLDARSVGALANAANVHPVYLARQFRRWYGCSITEYRRSRRAQRAAAIMAGCGRTLARVSHDAEFADQAHMCRVFRTETGMTPGAFRAIIRT